MRAFEPKRTETQRRKPKHEKTEADEQEAKAGDGTAVVWGKRRKGMVRGMTVSAFWALEKKFKQRG